MVTLALVLTPVASANALAALCALDGIDVDVVPTSRGAVAVRSLPGPSGGMSSGAGEGSAADTGGVRSPGAGGAPGEEKMRDELAPVAAGSADETGPDIDWDIGELLDEGVPAEAKELAARISRLTRLGVVLVTARLTEDAAFDAGLSGQISATRYLGGEAAEDLAPGLVLAGADDLVEDLLLGRRPVAEVPGHVNSREAGKARRARRIGRGLRRPQP